MDLRPFRSKKDPTSFKKDFKSQLCYGFSLYIPSTYTTDLGLDGRLVGPKIFSKPMSNGPETFQVQKKTLRASKRTLKVNFAMVSHSTSPVVIELI